jgi:hypothetical protein
MAGAKSTWSMDGQSENGKGRHEVKGLAAENNVMTAQASQPAVITTIFRLPSLLTNLP